MQDDFGSMIPDRRSGDAKIELLELRVQALELQLKVNTELTQKTNESTSELMEILSAVKGGLKVLEWLGKMAKVLLWIGALGAFCSAVWDGIRPGLASQFPRLFH